MLIVLSALTCAEKSFQDSENEICIGFYNLDNLYDTIDSKSTYDEDFTPQGRYHWDTKRYQSKLKNLSQVINLLNNGKPPDVLGVCEVENRQVLLDLFQNQHVKGNYQVVHFDSEDERGSDVAFIYDANKFSILDSACIQVKLSKNLKDKTRDILWVKTVLKSETDTFQWMICHFPSRKEGQKQSEINRIDAAKACKQAIDSFCLPSKQNLILMGDFNDEPHNISISQILGAENPMDKKQGNLLNLMSHFKAEGKGTYRYRSFWDVLDQFIVSKALCDDVWPDYLPTSVSIYSEPWLFQTGKYKGFPLRTFGGEQWLNGYSDHLPISMSIKFK